MQGSYNKIYKSAHEIIVLDTNKGKNNVDRVTAVVVYVSDVGTVGGIMSEGGFNMMQGTYLLIHSRI